MPEAWSVRSKVCVVTGASSGVGREVARGLAHAGARVALVSRTKERGETARASIAGSTPGATLDLIVADLSSQEEVRRAAREIDAAFPEVKVLINNAGGIFKRLPRTPEGLEYTFAVNHMAYFLLTFLLLPKLRASAPARIVNISSEAHWGARWDWDNLQAEKHYHQLEAYCNSKLANLLFTSELSRRLAGSGVTANAVHPGFVRSGFGRTASVGMHIGIRLASPFGLSARKGAETPLWAATAPELDGVAGKYFVRRAESASSALSQDDGTARRLWELSERLAERSPAPAGSA